MPPQLQRQGTQAGMSSRKDISGEHHDGASHDLVANVVDKKIHEISQKAAKKYFDKLEAKSMIKPNCQVSIQISVHSGARTRKVTIVVPASIRLPDLESRVQQACSVQLRTDRHKLYFFDVGGDAVELNSQPLLTQFFHENWHSLPWVMHIHGTESAQPLKSLCSDHMAKILFDRYDVNGNGRLERWELYRLLNDLKLDDEDLSPALVKRYVEGQFQRLDTEEEDSIGLDQFVRYVADMTRWMRTELMIESHQRNLFEVLAARALEAVYSPADVPPPFDDGNGRPVSIIDTGIFGIRLEIPEKSLLQGTKVSVRTLNPHTIRYLSEGIAARDRGEFVFSPVVRVDYPAFEDGEEPPELGSEPAPPFQEPLTLIMPHCFEPEDGKLACVFLGAPHGATQFERLSTMNERGEILQLADGELRVPIPYAGTFCAFSSLMIDDIAAVRFYIYTREETPREGIVSLRVHICPNLADRVEEMDLTESAQWGVAKCVGSSPVLYLCQGARFNIRFHDQEQELTWHGLHVSCELQIPIASRQGQKPSAGDPDDREVVNDDISVNVLEGVGKRASKPKAVAAAAGISATDYKVPFTLRLRNHVRPFRRPHLKVKYRTQNDFTLAWRAPKLPSGDDREITHYSIELATTDPSGTYYPWKDLWCGAGHACPDFFLEAKIAQATKNNDIAALTLAERTRAKEKLDDDETEAALDREAAQMVGTKVKINPLAKPSAQKAGTDDDVETFYYTLRVDPTLFGKVRLRYWVKGECRPSLYSDEVTLPRYKGIADGKVDAVTQSKYADMRRYFEKLTQHVTNGGKPMNHRIGNATGLNKWGGDSIPQPPPPPPDKEKKGGVVMAPVPYDVPAISASDGQDKAAGVVLAQFYRDMGVQGGGGGLLCGLTIDHVMHAVMGSPTSDGNRSPRRTFATLQQPLMAFCEVTYVDVLLPMIDTVVGAAAEWQALNERLDGIIQQAAKQKAYYAYCEEHVKHMIEALVQIYETLLHCQEEQALTFHLKHEDYSREMKKECNTEAVAKINDIVWRLSTELLELQLTVKRLREDRKAQDRAANAMRVMPARFVAMKGMASNWHAKGTRAVTQRKEEEERAERERIKVLTARVVSDIQEVPFARAKISRSAANQLLKLKSPTVSAEELASQMAASIAAHKAKAKLLERAELAAIERARDHMVERQQQRQKSMLLLLEQTEQTRPKVQAPTRRGKVRRDQLVRSKNAVASMVRITSSIGEEEGEPEIFADDESAQRHRDALRREMLRQDPPSSCARPPSTRSSFSASDIITFAMGATPGSSRATSPRLRTPLSERKACRTPSAPSSPRSVSTEPPLRRNQPPRRSVGPGSHAALSSPTATLAARLESSMPSSVNPLESRLRLVLEIKRELLERVESMMQYLVKGHTRVAPPENPHQVPILPELA